MPTLPAPAALERICRGLATLDAILSEDWESRYFSFNAKWGRGQRMGSMRNGSGDDWFFVFGKAGTFFKSYWHEHRAEADDAIYAGLPRGLAKQRTEPAFLMDDGVTFGGFHDGKRWALRGNATPLAELWPVLQGNARAYRTHALEYFELKVPLATISHVLAGKPLTAKVLATAGSERTLEELTADLAEIGYGR
jgi:hypothetical protein